MKNLDKSANRNGTLCLERSFIVHRAELKPFLKNFILPAITIIAFCLACLTYANSPQQSKEGDAVKTPKKSLLLARDGACLFRIVVPENPPLMVRYAAKELADYLEKEIGSRPPVVNDQFGAWYNGPGNVQIFLGKSKTTEKTVDFSALKPDSFLIDIQKNKIIIAGNDYRGDPPKKRFFYRKDYDPATGLSKRGETGTLFGVYRFLRKYCGIEWYMPGAIGEVVPSSPTLTVPIGKEIIAPHYIVRTDNDSSMNIDPEYAKWYRRVGFGASNDIDNNHGLHMFHYETSHPEFFSLKKDGTRDSSKKFGINGYCLSNNEFRKTLAQDIRKKFADNPTLPGVSIMPGDHQGPPPNKHYCTCKDCMKYYDPEAPRRGAMSNYVWGFVNDIAKEIYKTHPDKLIFCNAYNWYLLPPTNLKKVSPNIAVGIVINFALYSWSDEYRQEINSVHDFWENHTKHLYIWAHRIESLNNSSYGTPLFNWKSECELLKKFAPCADRFMIQFNMPFYTSDGVVSGKRTRNRGASHLPLYMLAQTLWNPELNPDELFNDYLRKFYGPAAEPMGKFFRRCDEVWIKGNMKANAEIHAGSKEYLENQFGVMPWQLYTREVVNELAGYLKQADNLSRGIYKKRVAIIKKDVGDIINLQRDLLDLKTAENYSLNIARTKTPPTLDGAPDELCWKNNKWIELLERCTKQKLPYAKSSASVLWDEKNLYIAFKSVDVQDRKIKNFKYQTPEFCAPIFEVDVSIPGGNEVRRVILTDDGQIFTKKIICGDKHSLKSKKMPWQANITAKIKRDNGLCTAEIAIPFASLSNIPKNGDKWKMNFGRRNRVRPYNGWRGSNLVSWTPVSPVRNWLNFGVMPDELGTVVFQYNN